MAQKDSLFAEGMYQIKCKTNWSRLFADPHVAAQLASNAIEAQRGIL